MLPSQALSPRDRIWPGSLKILFIWKTGWWSLAELEWREDEADPNDRNNYHRKIGCRWNGRLRDPDDKGNPRSHGQGTWFILPDELGYAAEGVAKMLKALRLGTDVEADALAAEAETDAKEAKAEAEAAK